MSVLLVIILISPLSGVEQLEYPVADWESCVEAIHTSKFNGFYRQKPQANATSDDENKGVIMVCITESISTDEKIKQGKEEGLHILPR